MERKKGIMFYREIYRDHILTALKDYESYEFTAINIDENIFLSELGKGIIYKTYEDYLKEDDFWDIDKEALNLCKNWYKNENEDITYYEGISLGQVVEYEFMPLFITILKHIRLLEEMINSENQQLIIVVDDNTLISKTVIHYSYFKSIPLKKVALPKTKPNIMQERNMKKNQRYYLKNIKDKVKIGLFKTLRFILKNRKYKRTILIISNFLAVPIIKEIIKNKDNKVIFVNAGIKDLLYLRSLNVIPVDFKLEVYNARFVKAKHKYAYFLKDFEKLKKDVLFKNRITYRKIPLWGLIEEFVFDYSSSYFSKRLFFKDFALRLINSQGVNSIFVFQDLVNEERILALLGNTMGKLTVTMQHGVWAELHSILSPISQKIIVWGEAAKRGYLRHGVPAERIEICGNPLLEKTIINQVKHNKNDVFKRLGMDLSKKTILFLADCYVNVIAISSFMESNILLEAICQATGDLQNAQLVVRFHPSTSHYENIKSKKEIIRKYNQGSIFIDRNSDLFELINVSDLILTFNSTAAFEAMVLKKPVVVINLTGKRDLMPFVESGAAWGIYKKEEIRPRIRDILNKHLFEIERDDRRRHFIDDQVYDLKGGKAASRINSLLQKSIDSQNYA